MYDEEGTRKDVEGKPGKVKAMVLIQTFDTRVYAGLPSELLLKVLQEASEDEILISLQNLEQSLNPSWT